MANRVYYQYRQQPKAVAWLEITETIANGAAAEFQEINDTLNIDTQEGVNLDVIGRIVGIDRQYIPISLDQDATFRTLIKAKIFKNGSTGTIDDAIKAITYILPDLTNAQIVDYENMTFGFIIMLGTLTDEERYLLVNYDIMPRPQGVRFLGFFETENVIEFGDTDAELGDTDAEFAGFTEVNY